MKELLKSGEPDEEYQIFIGAQAALFLAGEEGRWAEALRGLIGKFSLPAKEAIEECMRIFPDPLLPGASELGEIAASLNRRELWQRKAKRFAEVLSRFVKDREERWSYGGDIFPSVLDDLYRARAERLVLGFRTCEGGQEEGYPVAHLQTRRLSEEEGIPLSNIRWSATRFVPTGRTEDEMWLYRRESPVRDPLRSWRGSGILPDLAFIIDSSGSMDWEPYSGKGKFDLLLRAIYSALRWIEEEGVGCYLNYAVVNFSDQTLFSGWHSWYRLDRVKEVLFTYQGGLTQLDGKTVHRLIREAPRQFAALMVTDGELEPTNAAEVVAEVSHLFQMGHQLSLVQIGGKGRKLSSQISRLGADVHRIKRAAELPSLVLRKVKERFGSSSFSLQPSAYQGGGQVRS